MVRHQEMAETNWTICSRLNALAPIIQSILRVLVGLLFLEHGTMKAFHFPAAMAGEPATLPPLLMFAAGIEIVGGALITLGLATRIAAFFCAGEMAVAYFQVHAAQGPWPAINGGDSAILYCWIFLYFVTTGGGFGLDSWLQRRKAP